MKTSAMQRTVRMATVLLLLAYAPAIWAQHHGRGRAAFDEVFIDLRQPGKLEKEFPKEKIEQVRVLHLRGPFNSDDMRFVKRLADRSKVVDEKGDKVEAYLDLDMEEDRCERLQNIFVEEGNAQYADIDGVLFSADYAQLLLVPCRRQGSYSIPQGTVAIGDYAMNNCRNITMVDIPETVESIGAYAFSKCTSLTTMALPEMATRIGKGAFSGCSSLTAVTLPSALTQIPAEMFDECSNLMTTCMPEGVVSIGEEAYHKCTALTEVTLPRSVTTIGDEAFRGCKNMTMFKMYDGVTKMGDKIVYDCKNLNTFFSLCPIPPEISKVTDGKVALVVPAASVELYKKAKGWKKFRTISGI